MSSGFTQTTGRQPYLYNIFEKKKKPLFVIKLSKEGDIYNH